MTLVDEIGEVAGVGGWEFDVATSTCTWSRAVARILELDALTTPLDAFVALQVGDGRAQLAAWLHDATTSGNWFDRELEVRLPSGRHAWVRTTGRFTGGVVRGIIHDVTARRRMRGATAKTCCARSSRARRAGSQCSIATCGISR